MTEKNLGQKLLIIGIVLVVGALLLIKYDHDEGFRLNLRAGQDIAGGVSMIFEINDQGLENDPNLANTMKELLQRRVDPQGVYDLTWRVHGRNRLEVAMPLPPPEAKERQQEFLAAQEALFSKIPRASQIEAILRLPADKRPVEIERLAAGVEERRRLLERAAERFDAYQSALETRRTAPASQPADGEEEDDAEFAVRDAQELYEDAVDAVLATNLNPQRFQEILEMQEGSQARKNSIDDLLASHPSLRAEIEQVIEKYDRWESKKGFLDGPADLQRLLRGAGVLEFRILTEPNPQNATQFARYREQLQKYGPRPRPGDTEGWFKIDNPVAFFNLPSAKELRDFDVNTVQNMIVDKVGDDFFVLASLDPTRSMLHGEGGDWKLERAAIDRDPRTGRLVVNFQLDAIGAGRFGELTQRNIGKELCILVDDVAYSAAVIREKITRTGQISGEFSVDKVQYLVQTMQAGALPARLKDTPLSERTIGSSLGQQNLDRALLSGIIALVAVCGFLILYYRWCGLIASFGMLFNIMLTMSMMALLQARITLPGIAGLILSLGMVVDANILIYERMREEKERGSSLRMMIKNGYDKAMSTIIDSNITVILTAVIMYYVGSEEVKGFGLTLGWGVMLSLFTSVFVTRVMFAVLMRFHLIKNISMLKFVPVPNIDWYGLRKIFVPASIIVIVVGLGLLALRPREELFDVEFNGGVAAEIELKHPVKGEDPLREAVDRVAEQISADAPKFAQAEVTQLSEGRYRVRVPGVRARLIEAIITEPLEERQWLVRGGVDRSGGEEQVDVRVEGQVTKEDLQGFIRSLSETAEISGRTLARASFGIVLEGGPDTEGRFWNVTTTEKNRRLVQWAMEEAFGEQLERQPQIAYNFRGQDRMPYPITETRLESIIPNFPADAGADVTDYRGGAAMWFDDLDPPQSLEALRDRLRAMRLQPGYQDYPYRPFDLLGVTPTGAKDDDGNALYKSVVLVVADPAYRYSDDPDRWASELAQKELRLATQTFDTEQALRRVSQFKPQVAASSARKAVLALAFSWAMIIAYMWVRFGRASYGITGVIALVHDVLVAFAAVGLSAWIAATPIGRALLIEDFRIDMTVIAALLTIIGFSINDTIVTFDRIRELRGRLGILTPKIINDAINQCLSRTLITSAIVTLTVLIMYIWGGSSIRGFNYTMLIGCISGVYSSLAIAAPLLLTGRKAPAEQTRVPARAVPA